MRLFFVGSALIAYYYGYDESQPDAQQPNAQYEHSFPQQVVQEAFALAVPPRRWDEAFR